jgi:hypothetical protein
VRIIRAFMLLAALSGPVLADDSPAFLAGVKDSADQLQLYFDFAGKSGKPLDFSQPPLSDLFARVYDLKQLQALPPVTAKDGAWLIAWSGYGNGVAKSIMYFGISPPVNPVADQAAIAANMKTYEDSLAVAFGFSIRILARSTQSAFLFMTHLKPADDTPIRQEGFASARAGAAETVYGVLIMIAAGLKPGNTRLLSAAMRDTADAWAADILPKDRPLILAAIAKARAATTDGETQKNLAAFGAAIAAAKDSSK